LSEAFNYSSQLLFFLQFYCPRYPNAKATSVKIMYLVSADRLIKILNKDLLANTNSKEEKILLFYLSNFRSKYYFTK
jgi:hypothetical protein